MRRSQKDFLYLLGTLGFSALCLSDIKNTWQMLLFLLAFAGLNLYNYIKHKRNEEKWDDILDEMDEEDEDRIRGRRKKKSSDKDRFDRYIRNIEDQFDFDDEEEDEEYDED